MGWLLVVLLSACAVTPSVPTAAEAHLLDGMTRRLAIAREVAWIKYVDGLPVRDPAREAAVLDSLAARAGKFGLAPDRTVAFFRAQIAASCSEQARWMKAWSRGAPLPCYAPRSLRTAVRGDIDAIDTALLTALAGTPSDSPGLSAAAERFLRHQGIGSSAARLAAAPLGK